MTHTHQHSLESSLRSVTDSCAFNLPQCNSGHRSVRGVTSHRGANIFTMEHSRALLLQALFEHYLPARLQENLSDVSGEWD